MFIRKFKRFILLCMLTSFVSQAVAFEFYSQVIKQNHQQQQQTYQSHSSMAHDHHNMMMNTDSADGNNKQHTSTMNMDCCQNGDNCFMSTCHAYMAPPSFALASNERITEQVIPTSNFYTSFTAASLYRPPVAA